ncbi:MAG: DUF2264 domain-containing protein [Hungatella sp.]|nr:DUF2264 domain-containing protein [Hungatella sp.]
MKFVVKNPDFLVSPYTGMTREHWLSACEFLLEGIFSNLSSEEDLPVSRRVEFEVSYPRKDTSPAKDYAEKFEGLARSFLIAAPLLRNRPRSRVKGISVAEYYKNMILWAVTEGHKNYLKNWKDLLSIAVEGETTFQHTCECASLVIGLDQCREVIWETYTEEEQKKIAEYLMGFGVEKTESHNWRLFNMLILGFLWKEGYEIDTGLMRDHSQSILTYYAGDGWYRDGHRFDYYTPWAFQVYGPVWNQWYGYENEPEIAAKIEEYANAMTDVFSSMFDSQGHVTLWGRSGIYRNAAASPYASAFLLNHPKADPGYARWVNSGALLQFITREDVFVNGVPALGFYGQFLPMVQGYSCAESPYWIANPMVALTYPEDHPFWTARENRGDWDHVGKNGFVETVMDGPGIAAARLGANGACEFRTAKGLFEPGNEYVPYYVRLGFHSHYPWEAFDYGGAEAMQYSLSMGEGKSPAVPNVILYGGVKSGVLYRKEYFDFRFSFQALPCVDLADFPVAGGMVRVDKFRIPTGPFTLTMGAYGFPVNEDGTEPVVEYREDNKGSAVILKGKGGRQMALVTWGGWQSLKVKRRTGVNPFGRPSILAYGILSRSRYYEYGPYVAVSAILTKEDDSPWTDEELFPIESISYGDRDGYGAYGPVTLAMKDGRTMVVDYDGLEGHLML